MTAVSALAQLGDPNGFNGFLILGYALMWIVGLIYIGSLVSRQRNVRQDIHLMRQILQDDDDTG